MSNTHGPSIAAAVHSRNLAFGCCSHRLSYCFLSPSPELIPRKTLRILVNWLRVDQEVAAKSYELGKRSWSESGVVSDAAVKVVIDQSILELKTRDAVPLDKVRN